MRTMLTAFIAAFMLAAPAAANPYYTLETTFTATPVQVGDRATFTLTMTLVADPVADAAAGVTVFGSAWGGSVNIYDGAGGLIGGGNIRGPSIPGLPDVEEFKSYSSFQFSSDFLATVSGQVEISIGCAPTSTACPQAANPYDTYAFFQDTAPVSASPVPGPVLGAGMPGLIMASVGLFGWWRRRRR